MPIHIQRVGIRMSKSYKAFLYGMAFGSFLMFLLLLPSVVKASDENGEVIELICSYDHDTKSGVGTSIKKVKSAIHWISADYITTGSIKLFETLYSDPNPDTNSSINPNSMIQLDQSLFEKSLANAKIGSRYQFERNGYFILDEIKEDELIFNRIVTLKDTWAKIQKKKK